MDEAEIARETVADLAAGQYEAAVDRFRGKLARQSPPAALKRAWETRTEGLGEFLAAGTPSQESAEGTTVFVVPAVHTNGIHRVSVVVDDEGLVAGLWLSGVGEDTAEDSPPSYADPERFVERSVSVGADASLPGTLAVPSADGEPDDDSLPGVVLVHGSGRQNRDGRVGSVRPLRDLAWGLADRGVAVLRYDKRTLVSELPPTDRTVSRVVVDDAVAAVDHLRGVDAVDPERVVVVGHSLGGMLAPRIVERHSDAAGFAALAANARSLGALILEQVSGLVPASADLDPLAADLERADAGTVTDDEEIFGVAGTFWRSLQGYDPCETAAGLDTRSLFLQGGRDEQVSVTDDFERWREAVGGDATFRLYDDLNHLLVPADAAPPHVVSRRVVADLADWIDGRTPPAR